MHAHHCGMQAPESSSIPLSSRTRSQPRRERHRHSADLLGREAAGHRFSAMKRYTFAASKAELGQLKARRKEASPAAKTRSLSVMHRFGQLPMMFGGALCPREARLHMPPLPWLEEERHHGSRGTPMGIRSITTARGCGVSPLTGKQGSLSRPCPEKRGEEEAGARRLQPTSGVRRDRSGAPKAQPTRRITVGLSQRARRRTGAARTSGPLPASRRAAPSSTLPESSWRGMVLPAGTQGFSPADGGEAGAGAPAGLRRALLGPGRFPRRRR